MRAGKLRFRVQLQSQAVTGRDAYGDQSRGWTTVGTYWADVKSLTGRELVNAQQLTAKVSHKVTMRYVGDVSPAQQLLFRGKTLKIEWVDNVDLRNRQLDLYCQEVVVPTS